MHQSIVEVGTKICSGIDELAEEIIRIRRDLADAAERVGLRVGRAGTHPFSNWMDQVISPGERYEHIVEELQQLARSLLIFGSTSMWLCRSIGHDRFDERGAVLSAAPARAVDELAVWMGRATPESFRTTVFRRFPHGHSGSFGSWSEYEEYVDRPFELHCIDNGKLVDSASRCGRKYRASFIKSIHGRSIGTATWTWRRDPAGSARAAGAFDDVLVALAGGDDLVHPVRERHGCRRRRHGDRRVQPHRRGRGGCG